MNREVCELFNSTRGKQKIVVRGYLLVKDTNRDEKYYWCCEYRDAYSCMGRATTVLEGQEHVLKKFKEHNHAPDASHAEVVQALDTIKRTASQSHDLPTQIIQNTVVNIS